ncbi:hypothetical protein LguiB_026621 [Lonicera macranthoides]
MGERKYLFAFAGSPRSNMEDSIRSNIINQCLSSQKCALLHCLSSSNNCNEPREKTENKGKGEKNRKRGKNEADDENCSDTKYMPKDVYRENIHIVQRGYTDKESDNQCDLNTPGVGINNDNHKISCSNNPNVHQLSHSHFFEIGKGRFEKESNTWTEKEWRLLVFDEMLEPDAVS